MLELQTILHPTDFSERSQAALAFACALARDQRANLVLLHVVSRPAAAYGEMVAYAGESAYRQAAENELGELQVPYTEGHVTRRVEEGEPADEILRLAEDVGADLIVLGTHGRRGLSRLLMGSVAELVVRRASCPVLTVKAGQQPHEEPDDAMAVGTGEAI